MAVIRMADHAPVPRQAVDRRVAAAQELLARWPAARPFAVVAVACVVFGGVVAAVTRPTGFELGPWVAAFLVLVGGVSQLALGAGQAWLAGDPPSASRVRLEVAVFNTGAAGTVAGTLLGLPVVTTLAGVVLAIALVLFLVTTRARHESGRLARAAYLAVVTVVLVSIPVGLVLAWIRHA